MAKSKNNEDAKLCEAALRVAASHEWQKVTLEQIAKTAKISVAQIQKRFADPNAILPLIVDELSAQPLKAVGKPDRKTTAHDRLFEILMARFDVMQTWRKAILSIAAAVRHDPRMAFILAPPQIRAMKQTLDFAGFASVGACSKLTPLALWAVFLATFRTWTSDETPDMSRTMAALDRYLRYADRVAVFCRIN